MSRTIVFTLIVLSAAICFGETRRAKSKTTRFYNQYGQRIGGTRTDYGWKYYYDKRGTIQGKEKLSKHKVKYQRKPFSWEKQK